MRKRPKQLEFAFRTWGGVREGAGRPPNGRKAGVSHLGRERLSWRHPVHVTLKVLGAVGNLRKGPQRRAIFRAFAGGRRRFGFRLVEFSVQRDHLHLVCEAENERSLARGLQGLCIRIARGLNRRLGRRGRVFADRYHAHQLRTPREVRHALAYVLGNARRHGLVRAPGALDPVSSSPLFAGWKHHAPIGSEALAELRPREGPTIAAPRTWLLRVGWARRGRLDPDVVPGPG